MKGHYVLRRLMHKILNMCLKARNQNEWLGGVALGATLTHA